MLPHDIYHLDLVANDLTMMLAKTLMENGYYLVTIVKWDKVCTMEEKLE